MDNNVDDNIKPLCSIHLTTDAVPLRTHPLPNCSRPGCTTPAHWRDVTSEAERLDVRIASISTGATRTAEVALEVALVRKDPARLREAMRKLEDVIDHLQDRYKLLHELAYDEAKERHMEGDD